MTSARLPSIGEPQLTLLRPPTSHSTRLPQELVEEVIEYLADDKYTLKQCSLVCGSWVPSTSRYLFDRLLWPPCHHQWPSFVKSNNPQGLCRCNPLSGDFVYLSEVLSSLPRISSAVVELQLCSARKSSDAVGEWDQAQCLSPQVLLSIWDKLPRLRSLHFVDCHYPWYCATHHYDTRRSIDTVRFRVSADDVPPSLHILQMLRCFDHISELTIEGFPRDIVAEEEGAEPPAPARTSRLTRIDTLEILNRPPKDPSPSPPGHFGRRPLQETLGIIRSRIDVSSILTMRLLTYPNLLTQALAQDATNLTSLTYTGAQRAFTPPTSARITSLTARYIMPFDHGRVQVHEAWRWKGFARDVRSMLHKHTEDITVVVILANTASRRAAEPCTPEESLGAVIQFFQSVDWADLAARLDRCVSLRRFCIDIRDARQSSFGEYANLVVGAVHAAIEPQLAGPAGEVLDVVFATCSKDVATD